MGGYLPPLPGIIVSEVRIYGIRHHGPGSSRSLLKALDSWQPDAVLIEGMPEIPIRWVQHSGLATPVAAVFYPTAEPARAIFAPFAEFSPEWVALQWALERGVQVRFIDLAATHYFAKEWSQAEQKLDPFAILGEVTGYRDGEAWWDDQIESHIGSEALFEAVGDLMEELRGSDAPDELTAYREAAMRIAVRQAAREGLRSAVVVGAWHVPAIRRWDRGSSDLDLALVKELPKVPVTASWVPWNYDGLAFTSGYGAGVLSPMFYEFCWRTLPEHRTGRWLAMVAGLLRDARVDVSPAAVIEAARSADFLAALRSRREPGLHELVEAAIAVMADGRNDYLRVIADKALIGDRVGSVPPEIQDNPLSRDFASECKRLRLAQSTKYLSLDIRKPLDLERSRFFVRLQILGVPWGERQAANGRLGTFREEWLVSWHPFLETELVQASHWGSRIRSAAIAVLSDGHLESALPLLTERIKLALLADLPEAIDRLLTGLEQVAAVASDIPELLSGISTIATTLRIGATRNLDTLSLAAILERMVDRASLALPNAVVGTNDEEGERFAAALVPIAHQIGGLVSEEASRHWESTILVLLRLKGIPGFLAGRLQRHAGDLKLVSELEQEQAFARTFSPGNSHAWVAAWVQGFLGESGLALIYSDELFRVLDTWITGLDPIVFDQNLPLLRRSFGSFPKSERRQIGQRVVAGGTGTKEAQLDPERLRQIDSAIDGLFGGIT